ncbi:hypothetical protein I4U23_021175 [Adineta vaga]|nr:hypothetical protein I4U23_021175 [Adineta vaga]
MGKFFSPSMLTRCPLTTATRMNASYKNIIGNKPSKLHRWLFGMIIGSAPFLIILLSWMFVSICLNNLVRLYHYQRKRYHRTSQMNDVKNRINI